VSLKIDREETLHAFFDDLATKHQIKQTVAFADVRSYEGYNIGYLRLDDIDDDSIQLIASLITQLPICLFFELNNTEISDRGAEFLALLFKNKMYSVLSLSKSPNITEKGVKILEEATKVNNTFALVFEEHGHSLEAATQKVRSWILPQESEDSSEETPPSVHQNVEDSTAEIAFSVVDEKPESIPEEALPSDQISEDLLPVDQKPEDSSKEILLSVNEKS